MPMNMKTALPRRRGAATVELAIVLPLLLILFFGTVALTNMIYLKQSLKICAFEGTRIALLPGTSSKDVQFACQQMLDTRRIRNATVSVDPPDFQKQPYGTPIRVSVSADLSNNLLGPLMVLSDRRVTETVTMMKER